MNEMLKVLEEMLSEASDVSKHFTDALGGEDSPASPAVRIAYERELAEANRECTALTKAIVALKAAMDVVPVLTDLRTYGDLSRWPTADETLKISAFLEAMKGV